MTANNTHTFVVPAYGKSIHLEACLRALKKQTIKSKIIITTSTPSSFIENIAKKYNLKVIINQNSTGIASDWTFACSCCDSNYFTITLTDTSENETITIPDGNYTEQGLINVINNELSKLSGDFTNIVFLLNNTDTNGSGQTMVGCAPSTSFNFELNFQLDKSGNDNNNIPLPLKLGWILGFRNGKYINNQNYVSESILNTTTMNYLYLVIDDYNNNVNNNFYSVFNSSVLNKNVLARISLQTNTYDILLQNNLNIITTPREYFGPVSINNFNVQLLDPYGRLVDLNNMDFSFCLTLTTEYDI